MSDVKHPQSIVCIPAARVSHKKDGFVDYVLNPADLMIGQRNALESDEAFRQVLPIAVFMYQGKIWTYRRTVTGGESRLHGKFAVAVGGHFDVSDVIHNDSVIDIDASMKKAFAREIDEELNLKSNVVKSHTMTKMICADDTAVDRVHIAAVTLFELDGDDISSAEDQLDTVGFISPEELLSGEYDCEVWTTLIAKYVKDYNESK